MNLYEGTIPSCGHSVSLNSQNVTPGCSDYWGHLGRTWISQQRNDVSMLFLLFLASVVIMFFAGVFILWNPFSFPERPPDFSQPPDPSNHPERFLQFYHIYIWALASTGLLSMTIIYSFYSACSIVTLWSHSSGTAGQC
jgi:hypothetical protein